MRRTPGDAHEILHLGGCSARTTSRMFTLTFRLVLRPRAWEHRSGKP